MNVREMISMLSKFDPESRVVLEYDTHFFDIKSVQPQVILTQGSSWADYPGVEVLGDNTEKLDPAAHQVNSQSPRETAVAIWGTHP